MGSRVWGAPTTSAPSAAPGPAVNYLPSGPINLEELTFEFYSVCPGYANFYASQEYSTYLTVGTTARNTTFNISSGPIVTLAPTNEAFENLGASGRLSPEMASNSTLIGDLLLHNFGVANNISSTSALLCTSEGHKLEFEVSGAEATLEAMYNAVSNGTASMSLADTTQKLTLLSGISCPEAGFYAFSTNTLFVPEDFPEPGTYASDKNIFNSVFYPALPPAASTASPPRPVSAVPVSSTTMSTPNLVLPLFIGSMMLAATIVI